MSKRFPLLVGLLLSLCGAIQTNFASVMLHPRFEHHDEAVAKEIAVSEGRAYVLNGREQYWPEFQNRIAFALTLRAVMRVSGAPASETYFVLRLVAAWAAFFVFWLVLRRAAGATDRLAAAGLLLLSYALILHFNHGWEHPSDFLDPLVMSGFLWATWNRRPVWLALLVVLGALNRESAVFGGLLWFCVNGIRATWWQGRLRTAWRDSLGDMSIGVALMALGYGAVLVARRFFGGARGASQMQHTSFEFWGAWVRDLVQHPNPTSWALLLFAIVAPPITWVAANRRWIDLRLVGLLIAAAGIFGISTVFSLLPELRMLEPLSVVLIFAAVAAEAARAGGNSAPAPLVAASTAAA